MNRESMDNIHYIERVLRLFVGMSLIGSVFYIPVPFDYLIVLPLLGIYPCLTSIVGWDPIYYLADIDQTEMSFNIVERLVANELNESNKVSYLAPKFV